MKQLVVTVVHPINSVVFLGPVGQTCAPFWEARRNSPTASRTIQGWRVSGAVECVCVCIRMCMCVCECGVL